MGTAESCTGGLLAKLLTDLPGSSALFRGGIVSYTNAVKAGVLGVPQTLLDQYGAVSPQVAEAMARGAMYRDFERHAYEESCNLFKGVR